MRPFEWLIVVSLVPAILWSSHSHNAYSWLSWFAFLAASFVLVHARIEGAHWQMVPAYLATALLLVVEIGGSTSPGLRQICAILAALLVTTSLALCWSLPMFKLPRPTGRYPIGTRTLYLKDRDRMESHTGAKPGPREVVVQLWYPAATAQGPKALYRRKSEASLLSSYQAVLPTDSLQDAPVASGRFPVIVHNPAWHGFRQRSSYIAQDLASHGFVVAALSHPYNSGYVELSDGTLAQPDFSQDIGFSAHRYIPLHERYEIAEEELAVQLGDCSFALDTLQELDQTPGHPFESHLRLDRVGSYGYSYGGAVSAELARDDSRVRAALALDGVLHGGVALHGLDKPIMFVDSAWMADPDQFHDDKRNRDADPKTAWTIAAREESKQMWTNIAKAKTRTLSQSGGLRIIIDGLGHEDFTDQIFMSPFRRLSHAGSVRPARVAQILMTYVLEFFRQTLLDSPSALVSQHTQPFSEVRLEQWGQMGQQSDSTPA